MKFSKIKCMIFLDNATAHLMDYSELLHTLEKNPGDSLYYYISFIEVVWNNSTCNVSRCASIVLFLLLYHFSIP